MWRGWSLIFGRARLNSSILSVLVAVGCVTGASLVFCYLRVFGDVSSIRGVGYPVGKSGRDEQRCK